LSAGALSARVNACCPVGTPRMSRAPRRQERFAEPDAEYLVLPAGGVSPTGAKPPPAGEGAKAGGKAKRFTPFGNGIRNCVGAPAGLCRRLSGCRGACAAGGGLTFT